jgi:hypothetical protein
MEPKGSTHFVLRLPSLTLFTISVPNPASGDHEDDDAELEEADSSSMPPEFLQ